MNYIHLGRYGDIINTLPLLKILAGNDKVRLVVAAKYADVLDGVSYVEPIIYPGEFEDLRGAIEFAKGLGDEYCNLQVYGRDLPMQRHTANFVLEQWHRCGMVLHWGAPLVFDRRDPQREDDLVEQYCNGRPLVLLGLAGHSSPFPHAQALTELVHRTCGHDVQVLDLATVKADRIYDLLGLYDKAVCLIAIDTAHQHLAHASKVPVLAFSTNGPTPWHSSPKRAGHVFHAQYDQFHQRELEFSTALRKTLSAIASSTSPKVERKIIHVYPDHQFKGDALRRHTSAVRSWGAAYDKRWSMRPFGNEVQGRSARKIGDARDLPYMRDLIDYGISQAEHPSDIVLITNSDVGMVPDMGDRIERAIDRWGAFYTHRWDFDHSIDGVTRPALGRWYPGSDVFGFSVAWWLQHGHHYPDMIVGAEYVDCILRQLIKFHAGQDAEIHAAVYHERHKSTWEAEPKSPSNQHNAKLAHTWFKKHGTDDLDPLLPRDADQIRQRRATR